MLDYLFIFCAKYLYLAVIIIAVLYFLKQPKMVQKKIAIFGVTVLPLAYAAAKVAGLLYYDPRPFVIRHFIPLIPHDPDNGFPSDHVLLCAAIASALYPFNKKIGIILGSLTVVVGLSRVFAGVHHITDVLGSILISIIVSFLIYKFVMPIVAESKIYKAHLNIK